jgi:hypothetical protein
MKALLKISAFCCSLLLVCPTNAQTSQKYNPYESIGQEAEVLTLSKGKYNEFFDLDSIEIIGDAIFNTNTMKVVGFVERDTMYSEATLEPEIVSRWWAPDPVMQPHQSPYLFVANNPIIYIDQNGEDNVIYLVALPSSSTEFSVQDVKTVAAMANANYRNLGLETRVVIFESHDPFDPAHLDPNDSYAVLGSSSAITDFVSGKSFSSEIQDKARTLASRAADPEQSGTSPNSFEQGILIESNRVGKFGRETVTSKLGAAAFLITHGSGHNAGMNVHIDQFKSQFKDDNASLMSKGTTLTSNYSDNLAGFLNPNLNTDFTQRLMNDSYFGNNEARDNYSCKGIPFKMGSINPKTVNQTSGGKGVLKAKPKAAKSFGTPKFR